MMITGPIKRQLLKSADAVELQRVALSDGMMSLRTSGALLAIQGITSTSDVWRVTGWLRRDVITNGQPAGLCI